MIYWPWAKLPIACLSCGTDTSSVRADSARTRAPRVSVYTSIAGGGSCKEAPRHTALVSLGVVSAESTAVESSTDESSTAESSALERAAVVTESEPSIAQDTLSVFDPRDSVFAILKETIVFAAKGGTAAHVGADQTDSVEHQARELLGRVGLSESVLPKRTRALSGGQRQRVSIARALALRPQMLICDECVSALDLTVQARILDLLDELQRTLGLTILFITHDLNVARHISDRIYIMRAGKIREHGDTEQVFASPQDPYTQQLLNASATRA